MAGVHRVKQTAATTPTLVLLFILPRCLLPRPRQPLQLSAYGAELSSEACRELGFSSNLLCSSCDLLGEFGLSQIQPVCRQCCQQEAQLEARKVRGRPRRALPGPSLF